MKIAFYGSTNFSLEILKKLKDFDDDGALELMYVVSQSSKQLKFKNTIKENPVVTFCNENSITVLTPEKIKEGDFQTFVDSHPIDLALVAAYGKILPESLMKKSKYGFINFHGSILPKYRGAAPVQFSILNQDLENVGITIIKMDKGMDTGPMINEYQPMISEADFRSLTAGELMEMLAQLAAMELEEDFEYIFQPENWELIAQDESLATYCFAKDMAKENFGIKFEDGFLRTHGKIMAANPDPVAFIEIENTKFNLHRSAIVGDHDINQTGELSFHNYQKRLFIELNDGFLEILEIQPIGKKVMDARSFLNGYSKFINPLSKSPLQ